MLKHQLIESIKKGPRPKMQLFGLLPKSVDCRIVDFMMKKFGNYFSKSPWSHSYYSKDKDWGKTLDGTYRMSDHCNFKSNGKLHANTSKSVSDNTHWSVGVWNGDNFDILMSYPLNDTEENVKNRYDLNRSYIEENMTSLRNDPRLSDLDKLNDLVDKGYYMLIWYHIVVVELMVNIRMLKWLG